MGAQVEESASRYLWPFKKQLSQRVAYGLSQLERGLQWFEYSMFFDKRFKIPLSITFAEVATHNHFVLDRGGKVFKQTAPVIKLPAEATEDDHLALLGLLNSSTGCFWMKQVFYPKAGSGIGRGIQPEKWMDRFAHDGTKLKSFPIPDDPESKARALATALDQSAQRLADQDPAQVLSSQWNASDLPALLDQGVGCGEERTASIAKDAVRSRSPHPTAGIDAGRAHIDLPAMLDQAQARSEGLAAQMIALQEELDWLSYRLYSLTDADLGYHATPPEMRLGERPFEILLARRLAAGETQTTWFQRHNSTPITEIPAHWPADYRALTERRLEAAATNRWIRLVEQPEYKRRWNREPWESRQRRALRDWLLDHLEGLVGSVGYAMRTLQTFAEPGGYAMRTLRTVAQLAERARHDAAFQQVAALYTGTDTFDARALVAELVESDQVPQMAAARYKPKAMPKFRAWQETWDQQRAEDAIDARTALDPADPAYLTEEQARALKASEIGDIPLPPKYGAPDFRKPSYWGLRGKLDVPKERFFSLPGCERPGDTSLVIGWAGLDHLSRAQAIAAWYLERKEQDGWDAARLTPLLVALDELSPWLKQWHNALDPEFGERLGDYYAGFLREELRQLELSREDLLAWEPAARRGIKSA